jgi:hypothetical protein
MIKIVDNFYTDPSIVVNKFKDYCSNKNICPGLRSVQLYEIDEEFYFNFRKYICSLLNIEDKGIHMWTYLNEQTYDATKPECLNWAWPHVDGNTSIDKKLTTENYSERMIYGGTIFLSENPDAATGLKFYKEKHNLNWNRTELYDVILHGYLTAKNEYDSGEITLEELQQKHKEYYSWFDQTVDIANVYNRLVVWKCGTIRGTNFITEQNPNRLVHNFYITKE